MPFQSLNSFIQALDSAGELVRISAPVSPILEISEIADRQSKAPAHSQSSHAEHFDPVHAGLGGHGLLFENVEGSDFPVAINLWGSYRRMEMALGSDYESIARRIESLTRPQPPRSLGELFSRAREFLPLLRIAPRKARRAPCQEVVRLTDEGQVDLTRLGLIKCWPMDGDPDAVGYGISAEQAGTAAGEGRYITLAGMHTIHARDRDERKPSSHNIGMYRAQLVDSTRLAMHWHMHHDGAAHWRSWKRLGKPMPIAICLGGESVLPYAATAPLPPGISELLMAGFLNGRGIPMVRARTVPLRVPANSEIVIEGWVSTECGEIDWDPRTSKDPLGPGAVFEGPFGDHTGFYSLPDRYPLVEVTAVTHRRDAVYPTTVVGAPPMEDYYLGKATERVFLPLLKTIVHDIEDYHLPMFGCFHNCAAVQIQKSYPLQGRRVMHSIWGAGQMAWTKMIIVVDEDEHLHDEKALFSRMLERCDFRWDIEFIKGPLDILDQAAPELGAGTKVGFDATRKLEGDRLNTRSLEPPTIDTPEAHQEARKRLEVSGAPPMATPEWGARRVTVIGLPAESDFEVTKRAVFEAWSRLGTDSSAADLIIIVNKDVLLDDFNAVLFELASCTDPERDRIVDESTEGRRIAFDATSKRAGTHDTGARIRQYAPRLKMDDGIKTRVRNRWDELGLPRQP